MMLGAYSSRIVRNVGCAALTLLLAATTCPTFGAPTARAVESLSAAERASLPDGTLLKLKAGRTVSLGILRAEHKLRLQRFADAVKLGKQRALLQTHVGLAARTQAKLTLGNIQPQPTLVPMDFSPKHFDLEPQTNGQPGPLPADYLAFCKAALVTACLYLPSSQALLCWSHSLANAPGTTGYCYDNDPLITDQQLCTSEGGILNARSAYYDGPGCSYWYPISYSLNFNPGPPTQGVYNVTQSANCPSPFVNTVDPRGAVTVAYPTGNPQTITVPSPQSCVMSVFVKQ